MITMFWEESYGENNTEPNKHETEMEEDEEEETLSFYEFSMNNEGDNEWEDSSRSESQNSSFKSSVQEEDNYFEFFSGELKTRTTAPYNQPENIIFCGKIIPYKQPISHYQTPENVVVKEKKHSRRRGLFRWRSSFTSPQNSRTSSKNDNDNQEKKQPCTKKRSKIHGFPVQRMSIFTSPSKSRWYLYLFGITRFRSEMELRDIKNRQSRRSPSFTLFSSEDIDKKRECRGAWGLLRALSCVGGDHQATAVVPSVGCIRQV